MSHLKLFDVGARVIAKTFIAPLAGQTIKPGMTGEITDHQEIVCRHRVRFENGKEAWATSDQIKLDPKYTPKDTPTN